MKFSLSLLKKFINFNKDYTQEIIAKEVTNLGFEVEGVTNPAERYKNFIVAEVVESSKHPDSEKLTLCKVNTGSAMLSIVCGAKNARAGIKVVLAKIGAIVPANNMEIKKGVIRGEASEGMLCSASELCLEGGEDGIIELPSTAKVGIDFAEYLELDDPIFEISITPNRGDGACVYGIARDLAAKNLGVLKGFPEGNLPILTKLEVELKENLPEIYFAKAVLKSDFSEIEKDIKTYNNIWGSSGITPVDFINFQMFMYGMPMHIYDASKIEGKITIRRSVEGEDFVPIKGEPFKLSAGLLVVADNRKILSLLGVMGDARSKTESTTKEVVIEALFVDPLEVIQSSRASVIKSDSSYRFERGVDRRQEQVLLNTLGLLAKETKAVFAYKKAEPKREVKFNLEDYTKRIGYEVDAERARSILLSLGFEVALSGNIFTLKVPFFRHDVAIWQDICEEIARIEGYEKIKPLSLAVNPIKNIDFAFEVKKVLSREMMEVITYSFFKQKYFGLFVKGYKPINLLNPINAELSVMRDSLIPNLLEAIAFNEKKNYFDLQLFEVGTVFYGVNPEEQKTNIAGVFAGKSALQSFLNKERGFTIWDAKQKMMEVLYSIYGISESALSFKPLENGSLHTKQSFGVYLGKNMIAILGQIHPFTLEDFDVKQKVFAFEIFVASLPPFNPSKKKKIIYKEDILPDVQREIAIIVKKEIKFEEILNAIKKLKLASLKEILVKDIFENAERIGEGLKSISIGFVIGQEKETLTKEVIDGEIIGSIINALSLAVGAKIRDGETAL